MLKTILLLLIPALCWGPSYLFIKIAIPYLPPMTLLLLRVAIGGLLLFLFCKVQKFKFRPYLFLWKQAVIMGITLNLIPFCLINYAEMHISSSLTGILNSGTLIFTALLAHFFMPNEQLSKQKIFGILMGISGLLVIYLPMVLQEKIGESLGVIFVILACLSYGVGTVYTRTHLHRAPISVLLTMQLISAALIALPFALIFDHPVIPFPLPVLGSVLGLGVLGTAVGYIFYFKAIHLVGATMASLSTLLIPLIALALGIVFLGETLSLNSILGACLILLSVLVMQLASKKA